MVGGSLAQPLHAWRPEPGEAVREDHGRGARAGFPRASLGARRERHGRATPASERRRARRMSVRALRSGRSGRAQWHFAVRQIIPAVPANPGAVPSPSEENVSLRTRSDVERPAESGTGDLLPGSGEGGEGRSRPRIHARGSGAVSGRMWRSDPSGGRRTPRPEACRSLASGWARWNRATPRPPSLASRAAHGGGRDASAQRNQG